MCPDSNRNRQKKKIKVKFVRKDKLLNQGEIYFKPHITMNHYKYSFQRSYYFVPLAGCKLDCRAFIFLRYLIT